MRKCSNQCRRIRGPVALAFLSVFVFAALPAFASSDTVKDQSNTFLNPCPPSEWINYTGTLHTVENNTPTMINMMIQDHGRGVGTTTGANYNISNTTKIKIKTPPGDVLLRTWEKAVSTSSNIAPDFFFLQKTMVHADGSTGGSSTDYRCHQDDTP